MKKVFGIVLFFCVFFSAMSADYRGGITSITNYRETASPQFMDVYQKAVEMNRPRFKDINLIQIGDTVLFPSRYGVGSEAWIANYPTNGRHDCIWDLTGKYLNGQLITSPVDTVKVKTPEIVPDEKNDEASNRGFLWLLALIILAIAAFVGYRLWSRGINRNPVIPGGLSDDQQTALQQINAAYPNRPRALNLQRGVLAGPIGVSSVTVPMTFSDGVRNVTLHSGEVSTKVNRVGDITDYYRHHCGNLFGEVMGGGYSLPAGWTFVPTTPVHENIPSTPINATEVPSAPIPENRLSPIGVDATELIQALSNLAAAPKEIVYGDLKITFQKAKRKKDKKS